MSLLMKRCGKLKGTQSIYACLSTKPMVKPEPNKNERALRDFDKLSKVYTKKTSKHPQRPPFVKNMFMGRVDTDLLAYPEALDKEQLEGFDGALQPVRQFYDQWGHKGASGMSQEFVANARQLQLFGQRAPQLVGGRELNVTEQCRLGEIVSAKQGDVGLLNSELLGVQTVLKLGSEKQQAKYLEALVSGRVLSAFCMVEGDTGHLSRMNTTATQSGDHWILNGEKMFVINGDTADLFVVIANTEHIDRLGVKEKKPTVFLVERTFGGVTSKPTKMLGLGQTDIATVKFENTKVPSENIILAVNKGDEAIKKILTEYRLGAGPACSAITRSVLDKFIEYCKKMSDEQENLTETDLIRSKTSEIAGSLYAMESMTFFTAALIDQYEDQDCEMEAAIVKAFSAEQCHNSTLKCLTFIGSPAYVPDHWCNELHRDAISYLALHESVDTLKIMIALQGLQYAGTKLQGEVRKLRNPLYHAGDMLKRMWTQRRQMEDNPRLTLGLSHYLHPSASIAAELLEYCVLRLQFITEQLLARHGIEVVSKHMDLMRLAETIIDIYAMTASISRASRSYCIGLQHSDYEMLLANAFCLAATERIKENLRKAFVGPYSTNDGNHTRIGGKLFSVGRYYPEHPLTRNF